MSTSTQLWPYRRNFASSTASEAFDQPGSPMDRWVAAQNGTKRIVTASEASELEHAGADRLPKPPARRPR